MNSLIREQEEALMFQQRDNLKNIRLQFEASINIPKTTFSKRWSI
jgi:hypothetical protein